MLGGATEAAKMATWPVLVGRCGGTVCGRSVSAATILRRQFLATVLSLMVRASCNESYTECKYGGPLGRRLGRVMKVRLVRPRCFVLTMFPLKSLASWTV